MELVAPDCEAGGGLDFELLVDWVDARLSEQRADEVRVAVEAADPATQATVAWLQRFLAAARSMPLCEPPPVVAQHLRRHFRRWSQARATLTRSPERVLAALLFDSRLDLAPSGVRGVDEQAGGAHLAYTSERADLVLDLTRLGGRRIRIDGQVLPTDEGEAPVFEAVVVGPHGITRTVDGDELGRFCLPVVPDDATELRVTNGDLTIVAALDLRGPEPIG